MNRIEVREITKQFDGVNAVDHVTFTVGSAEIVGLLGPNGCGKTTLTRMLSALLTPSSGTALVNGCDLWLDPYGVRKSIGVVHQATTSDVELTVEEQMAIYAKLYGIERSRRKGLIDNVLEALALAPWRKNPIKRLSGGTRRRVEIARALVHEPPVLLLDEPTVNLDVLSRVSLWDMLKKLRVERGLTVLMTTHYLEEAEYLCDRLAIMDRGVLKAFESPSGLQAQTGHTSLESVFLHYTGRTLRNDPVHGSSIQDSPFASRMR